VEKVIREKSLLQEHTAGELVLLSLQRLTLLKIDLGVLVNIAKNLENILKGIICVLKLMLRD
jgi:hypothetical protein